MWMAIGIEVSFTSLCYVIDVKNKYEPLYLLTHSLFLVPFHLIMVHLHKLLKVQVLSYITNRSLMDKYNWEVGGICCVIEDGRVLLTRWKSVIWNFITINGFFCFVFLVFPLEEGHSMLDHSALKMLKFNLSYSFMLEQEALQSFRH
jgi:hypothetical protein